MGAMECSRKGCGEPMSHTYIFGIGYICTECKSEFKRIYGDNSMKREDIVNKLEIFIKTKKSYSDEKMTIDEFFNKVTS